MVLNTQAWIITTVVVIVAGLIAFKPDVNESKTGGQDIDLVSLPPTGAGLETCGQPPLMKGEEAAILLWKDCAADNWVLVVTSERDQPAHTVAGTITSDRPARLAEGISLEKHDVFDTTDPKRLAFDLNVLGANQDAIKFAFPSDANACVALAGAGNRILVGPKRVPVDSPINLRTMRGCSESVVADCGAPDLKNDPRSAAFVWKDCGSDQWILVTTGGNSRQLQRFHGKIQSDKPLSSLVGKSLEQNDVLVSTTPHSIDFEFNVAGPGRDQARFAFPRAADICFDLDDPDLQLLIGRDKLPVTPPVNLATMEACAINIGSLVSDNDQQELPAPDAAPPPLPGEDDTVVGTENCLHDFIEIAAPGNPPIPGSWSPTFEDNFRGAGLDGSKWKVGTHWWGTNGMANNIPENISVSCGFLELAADRSDTKLGSREYAYTMGKVSSFRHFSQLYGYYETRIRYDAVQGAWPAFWMMPDNGKHGALNRNRVSYLKFDLRNRGTAPVQQAHLELVVESLGADSQSLTVHHVEDDEWREDEINWQNRPTPDPLWQARVHQTKWSAGQTVRLDVTRAVNDALEGNRILTLAVTDTFMSASPVSFFSRESARMDHHPRLRLSGLAQPVPVAEDASVGQGRFAETNFGDQPSLEVMGAWGPAASTLDGGMEFDIMESLGHWGPEATSHALHWDGYESKHQRTGSGYLFLEPSPDGFHTYGMNWQQGLVEFYIDGKKTYEVDSDRIGSIASFLILGMQVGGWADGLGNARDVDDDGMPASMHVDYVKVWEGKSR